MLLSIVIFASYFAGIILILIETSREWLPGRHYKYKILAILSLTATWERMFRYFAWSFRNYHKSSDINLCSETIMQWLSSTSLFKEAWQLVVSSPEARLITQRICFATIFWTVFLHRNRNAVRHTYAYMLLGQTVAISFAMNLYFLAILNSKSVYATEYTSAPILRRQRSDAHYPTSTLSVQCIFIAVLSTLSMHFLPERFFLINLLLLHGILLIPLLVKEKTTRAPRSINLILATISFLYTLFMCTRCKSLSTFYHVICSNPAIGSIAGDVLMTIISITLWNGQMSNWDLPHLFATALSPLWQATIMDL